MPGIFGVVDAACAGVDVSRAGLRDVVARMAATMCYDSDYSVDVVSSAELGACIGRVGFTEGADSLGSPDCNPPLMLLLAGEAFVSGARPEVDAAAAACAGYGARDVLERFLTYGDEGLADITGGFAAAVIDRREGRCVIFNDRFGVERIFLHVDGTRIFFASEAKAILAVAPETRAFDPAGLAEVLGCGGTLAERSLFHRIEVLPGGTSLTLRAAAAPQRRRYFEHESLERSVPSDAGTFLHTFPEVLARAVNRSAHAVPSAGISLTGGLDSRMIVAALDASPDTVPCYTFGSMYRESGDVAVARQVAACIRQPFEVLTLDRQFLRDLPQSFEQAVYISDGYLGLSGAAELYVNRKARSLAPARLTGNWGGELMRGVRAFKFVEPAGDFLNPEMAQHVAQARNRFDEGSRLVDNPLSYSLFRQMPLQGYGRYAIERSQLRMRSPFISNEVVSALYAAPATIRASRDAWLSVIRLRPELLAIPTDMGLLGGSAPPLQFARRLQRKVVVKAEYLLSHGAPNWVAALTAANPGRQLERLVLGRNKFQHFRRWLRTDLAGQVRDTLSSPDAGLDAWFDSKRIETMVEDHIAGRGNYTEEIDKLMTVTHAQRVLFRDQATPARAAGPLVATVQ